ncbi:MAG: RNA 2',3'-cyclic phosphodiesterase [Streptomycetaceae bacterium]|nr:RNA 2',3'-cyclic phosphodiesterase [Streptomycetaceae bacterium]
MRLFVALDPPPDAVAELRRAVDPVRARHPELRWTATDGWHITLAFLGDVDTDRLPVLQERLARVAARHAALELSLTGCGRFGDRVLWTGVHGPGTALKALVAGVRRAAVKCGIDTDTRPWHGHVTLARASGRSGRAHRRSAPDLAALAADLADFAGTAWTADTLHLVQSVPGPGPAHYRDVGAWPMRGKPGFR